MLRTLDELPVMIVSGRAKPGDIDALRRAGALACFTKPVRIDLLARVVRNVLRGGPDASDGVPARNAYVATRAAR